LPKPEAHAYTDGASSGSRGPGGYGAVLTWKGKSEEISGGEQNTTNQRTEVTAARVALETETAPYWTRLLYRGLWPSSIMTSQASWTSAFFL
jgi:ribonuclease HI